MPPRPSEEVARLSPEYAQRIVAAATRRSFESRRSRVDAFVDRHFSFRGSAAMHRKAAGWDMLKAPANIALAVPNPSFAAHAGHLHVDVQQHGSSDQYRICQ